MNHSIQINCVLADFYGKFGKILDGIYVCCHILKEDNDDKVRCPMNVIVTISIIN